MRGGEVREMVRGGRMMDVLHHLYMTQYLLENDHYDYAHIAIQSAINILIDFLNLSILDADQIRAFARIDADEVYGVKEGGGKK